MAITDFILLHTHSGTVERDGIDMLSVVLSSYSIMISSAVEFSPPPIAARRHILS